MLPGGLMTALPGELAAGSRLGRLGPADYKATRRELQCPDRRPLSLREASGWCTRSRTPEPERLPIPTDPQTERP